MENSKIEWTDATFNPWEGCRKKSPACKNCYAETRAKRFGKDFAGTRKKTSDGYWRQPLKWNRNVEQYPDRCKDCHTRVDATKIIAAGLACPNCEGSRFEPHRPRVFCASLADVFEDWQGPMVRHDGCTLWICPGCATWRDGALPDVQKTGPYCGICDLVSHPLGMHDVRRKLFKLIDATPNLDWLLLTKRPENVRRMWPDFGVPYVGVFDEPPRLFRENVWIGTSVENQEYAEKRIPELVNCRDLSPVLFLSCEPLLGKLDLRKWLEIAVHRDTGEVVQSGFRPEIGWIIAGGESGPGARPSHPGWFRSLRDQCDFAGVPFHFKQWGEWAPAGAMGEHCFNPGAPVHQLVTMDRVGKKAAGRLLDGREHNGLPEVHDAAKH